MAAVLRSAVMVIDYWCVVLWLFVFDCCVLRLQNNDIKRRFYRFLPWRTKALLHAEKK